MGSGRRRAAALVAALAGAGLLLAGLVAPSAATPVQQPTLVSTVPSLGTPMVREGTVQALAQVGDVIVFGGTFTKVADRGRPDTTYTGLAAYDRRTNRLVPGFVPQLNGEVRALLPGPTPGTVYVGGAFSRVNDTVANRVVLLDVLTGQRVTTFKGTGVNGPVNTLGLVGNRLYIGGTFTLVAGQTHRGLAALNATTGFRDAAVTNQFLENHNYGRVAGSAKSPVGVTDLAITPDGTQMTAIGNFRTVDGLLRDQVVVMDLTGPSPVVRPDWSTTNFTHACYSWAFDWWVRDVDYSPDGSYFVIGSTGGGINDLCDDVARFETTDRGTNVQPTWVASTGGDSVYTVAATGPAIYAGGHFRWFNNPMANDRAGAGAAPRPGIAALDPDTGMPLAWNPGRHPRDKGVFAMLATDRELVLGTDTAWFGNQQYFTPKLVSIPLAGGASALPKRTPALPGSLNAVRGSTSSPTVSSRLLTTAGVGAAMTSPTLPGGVDVRGAFVVDDKLFLAGSDGVMYRRGYDANGVIGGTAEVVDPYNDPYWSTVLTGLRSNTETYRGISSGLGSRLRTATSLFFLDDRLYYTLSGSSQLYSRVFEPGSGTSYPVEQVVPGVSLPSLSGGTYAGGHLYYAVSNGQLVRQAFDGRTLGTPVVVGGPAVDGTDWRAKALFVGNGAPRAVDVALGSAPPVTAANHTAWQVSGTADPGAAVSVQVAAAVGTATASTTALGDGTWTVSVDVSALADGDLTLTVGATATTGATSQATATVTKTTRPGAPVITGSSGATGSVAVQFDAPAQTGGVPLTGFEVTLTAPDGSSSVTVLGADARSFSADGLPLAGTYTVSVVALNQAGPGPAATTTVSTRGEARVVFTPDRYSVTSGEQVTFTGSLTDRTSGAALPGRTVLVYSRADDGTRVRIDSGQVVTAADGSWTFTFAPTASLRYQADVQASDGYGFARSTLTRVIEVR